MLPPPGYGPARPFGQNLEYMAALGRRLGHNRKSRGDEVHGNLRMEQVGHTVDENPPRLLPGQGYIQPLRQQLDVPRRIFIAGYAHPLQPRIEGVHIAVVATGRHPGTTGNRVPSFIRPFNRRRQPVTSPSKAKFAVVGIECNRLEATASSGNCQYLPRPPPPHQVAAPGGRQHRRPGRRRQGYPHGGVKPETQGKH